MSCRAHRPITPPAGGIECRGQLQTETSVISLRGHRVEAVHHSARCHGNNGDGKGEVAIDENVTLSDFNDKATLKNKTDGELFYMVKVNLARVAG
jgi:hypothetical protein